MLDGPLASIFSKRTPISYKKRTYGLPSKKRPRLMCPAFAHSGLLAHVVTTGSQEPLTFPSRVATVSLRIGHSCLPPVTSAHFSQCCQMLPSWVPHALSYLFHRAPPTLLIHSACAPPSHKPVRPHRLMESSMVRPLASSSAEARVAPLHRSQPLAAFLIKGLSIASLIPRCTSALARSAAGEGLAPSLSCHARPASMLPCDAAPLLGILVFSPCVQTPPHCWAVQVFHHLVASCTAPVHPPQHRSRGPPRFNFYVSLMTRPS
jgi:hypothetical protein